MEKFTKLSVNGEVRYVAAIYDGSGNDIAATYETISNVSTKELALNGEITAVSKALEELTKRVEATEAFDTRITKNTEDIKTNADAIVILHGVDAGYRTELDSLTIKVGENTTNVSKVSTNLESLITIVSGNSNKIGNIEAIINDEAQGINALNAQVDKNIADIAKAVIDLGKAQTDIKKKVSTETFSPVSTKVSEHDTKIASLQEQINDLLGRIKALETPSDNPEEEPEVDPTDPEVTPEGEA
jgi:chromosome segregation ATPase